MRLPIALFTLLALFATACGGSKDAELERLKAENEQLKTVAAEQATLATGPAAAPSSATGTGEPAASAPSDDWAWANGTSSATSSGSTAPRQAAVEEPQPVRVEQAPEPARPKPPKPKPAPPEPQKEEPVNLLAPAPEPQPVAVTRTLMAGTVLPLTLSNGVSSATSSVGDPVEAVLTRDLVDAEGKVVLPAGTKVAGTVTEAVAAKKVEKKSALAFHFSKATLPDGTTADLSAGMRLEGKGWTKKQGGAIAGSAAGGALLGQVLGHDTGSTVAGAVIGGAIASGAVMSKKGEDVGVDAGTALDLNLETDASVTHQELR